MKFNINLEGLKTQEPAIAVDQFSITVEYTPEELMEVIAAYKDLLPQIIAAIMPKMPIDIDFEPTPGQ